jgi:hypothetical protein
MPFPQLPRIFSRCSLWQCVADCTISVCFSRSANPGASGSVRAVEWVTLVDPCLAVGGRLSRHAPVLTAGQTQLQVLAKDRVGGWGPGRFGQRIGPDDVTAGRLGVLVEGVKQEPLVERKRIGREGRHHSVAAGDGRLELLHLQSSQTILSADLGPGEGFLRTTEQPPAADQCQGPQQGLPGVPLAAGLNCRSAHCVSCHRNQLGRRAIRTWLFPRWAARRHCRRRADGRCTGPRGNGRNWERCSGFAPPPP